MFFCFFLFCGGLCCLVVLVVAKCFFRAKKESRGGARFFFFTVAASCGRDVGCAELSVVGGVVVKEACCAPGWRTRDLGRAREGFHENVSSLRCAWSISSANRGRHRRKAADLSTPSGSIFARTSDGIEAPVLWCVVVFVVFVVWLDAAFGLVRFAHPAPRTPLKQRELQLPHAHREAQPVEPAIHRGRRGGLRAPPGRPDLRGRGLRREVSVVALSRTRVFAKHLLT